MVYIALVLMFFAVALFVTEMFIPGFGVFGFTGIISLAASVYITLVYERFGVIIVLAEMVFLAVVALVIFNYVKKKQLHGKIILEETYNKDETEIGALNYLMDKEGLTKTPLKPCGTADFSGSTVEVYSDGEYISANKKVKVIDVSQRRVIVKQL